MPVLAVLAVVDVDLRVLSVLQVYRQVHTVFSLSPLDVRQQRHLTSFFVVAVHPCLAVWHLGGTPVKVDLGQQLGQYPCRDE